MLLDEQPHQRPTASITGMSVQGVDERGFTMDFDVDVTNPNSSAIPLTAADYRIGLGGVDVAEGKAKPQGSIPAGGTRNVKLPVTLTYENLLAAKQGIVKSGGNVPYALDGGLTFNTGVPLLGDKRVPLRYAGRSRSNTSSTTRRRSCAAPPPRGSRGNSSADSSTDDRERPASAQSEEGGWGLNRARLTTLLRSADRTPGAVRGGSSALWGRDGLLFAGEHVPRRFGRDPKHRNQPEYGENAPAQRLFQNPLPNRAIRASSANPNRTNRPCPRLVTAREPPTARPGLH